MSQRIGSTQQGRNQREQFYDSQKIIEELGIKFKATKTSNRVEEWYFNIMLAIGEGLTWWLSSLLPSGTGRFDPWVRKIPWRRKWQSITVLLPEKSHGQRSLAGYIAHGVRRVKHDLAAKEQTTATGEQESSKRTEAHTRLVRAGDVEVETTHHESVWNNYR